MHNIFNKIQQDTVLKFIHKRQASLAYKHKPVMSISKQLDKLKNEANIETEGYKCYISHIFITKCIQELYT